MKYIESKEWWAVGPAVHYASNYDRWDIWTGDHWLCELPGRPPTLLLILLGVEL